MWIFLLNTEESAGKLERNWVSSFLLKVTRYYGCEYSCWILGRVLENWKGTESLGFQLKSPDIIDVYIPVEYWGECWRIGKELSLLFFNESFQILLMWIFLLNTEGSAGELERNCVSWFSVKVTRYYWCVYSCWILSRGLENWKGIESLGFQWKSPDIINVYIPVEYWGECWRIGKELSLLVDTIDTNIPVEYCGEYRKIGKELSLLVYNECYQILLMWIFLLNTEEAWRL